jgi:hypothetical protein
MPRTAINLAGVALPTNLATAGERLAAESGWSCKDPPSLDMVALEEDAQSS